MVDTPEQSYASETVASRRGSVAAGRRQRREFDAEYGAEFGDDFEGAGAESPVRRASKGGVRLKFRLGIPKSKWGRIGAGVSLLGVLGLGAAGVMLARKMLLHDERFVIASSSSISIEGNQHLTQAQLLSVFGEDVERNIFTVSLAQRRAELEALPWVQHATVMRLLPDHLRVSIVERTPVAFVRQGGRIGLVDASGVLLDMPADAAGTAHYSFPVVTGIGSDEPLSTRAARMKIYEQFTGELDGKGDKISQQLSEVDLSSPEDVKALIADDGAEVLVHFGDSDYLERYKKYKAHLSEWRTQYPKLASVDMRYDRQVVLEMQPGNAVPVTGGGGTDAGAAASGASAAAGGAKSVGVAKAAGVAAVAGAATAAGLGLKKAVVAAKAAPAKAGVAGTAAVARPAKASGAGIAGPGAAKAAAPGLVKAVAPTVVKAVTASGAAAAVPSAAKVAAPSAATGSGTNAVSTWVKKPASSGAGTSKAVHRAAVKPTGARAKAKTVKAKTVKANRLKARGKAGAKRSPVKQQKTGTSTVVHP